MATAILTAAEHTDSVEKQMVATLHGSPHQSECWLQLCAASKEAHTGQDDQTQPGPGHGHYQSTNIAQVAHMLGAYKRENDVIILLALVAIHCCHLGRKDVGLSSKCSQRAATNSNTTVSSWS